MNIRTMQIWGFLLSVTGWIFVSCSMAMEAWKVAPIGGVGGSNIISVGWHWSSLWRECFTDSASTTRCYDFPVLWAVEGMNILVLFYNLQDNFLASTRRMSIFDNSIYHHISIIASQSGCRLHIRHANLLFSLPKEPVQFVYIAIFVILPKQIYSKKHLIYFKKKE